MRGAPAIRPKHATLIEMLDAAAQSELGLVFVNRKEQDQEVPFARIREQALSVAADLVRRGVRKGDRVALVLPTCPEFVECFFGVLCAGAIPVPLYPPLRLGKLDEFHRRTTAMLKAVNAAMVVTDERIRRFLGGRRCELGSCAWVRDGVQPGRPDLRRGRSRCRRHRGDPIFLGDDQRSQAGGSDPRESALESRDARAVHHRGRGTARRRRHLAAALPRHGIDRKSPQRFLYFGESSSCFLRSFSLRYPARGCEPSHGIGGPSRRRPASLSACVSSGYVTTNSRAWTYPHGASASTAPRRSAPKRSGGSVSGSGVGVFALRRSRRAMAWRKRRWP